MDLGIINPYMQLSLVPVHGSLTFRVSLHHLPLCEPAGHTIGIQSLEKGLLLGGRADTGPKNLDGH